MSKMPTLQQLLFCIVASFMSCNCGQKANIKASAVPKLAFLEKFYFSGVNIMRVPYLPLIFRLTESSKC
jgi:hypothetical protein